MAEDAEVPEGEEDDDEVGDEPVPRLRCANCKTVLASHSLAAVKAAQRQARLDEAAERAKQNALDERSRLEALVVVAIAQPLSLEDIDKPKRGGHRKKADPCAYLCSTCRRKAQAGDDTDAEDEKRFREIFKIHHPAQAKALAQQRRQGRIR